MNDLISNYYNLSAEQKKLVRIILQEQGIDINKKIILPHDREKKIFPMSFAQKRLWFLEKFEPESPLYIIPSGVKITGKVNLEFFTYAINEVVKRHEILRTKFISIEGEGFQEILDDLTIIPIEYDLSDEKLELDKELEKIFDKEFRTPFKLFECPLFRIVFIRISDVHNYLLLPMHHIISDNWSTGILIKELLEFYKHKAINKTIDIDPIKVQYADYASWQIEWLKGNELINQKTYWLNQLNETNEILEIIPDKKRPVVQTYNGSYELFKLDSELADLLVKTSKKTDRTVFTILLAAFQLVLSRYSNQKDLNIGVPVANRNRSEIENLIGFFINTIVLRGRINNEQTVEEFLEVTQYSSIDAYANQDIPFEMIVDELKLERNLNHTALFQAMLVFNNAPMSKLEIDGLLLEPLNYDTGKTKFDLVLSITPEGDHFLCKLEYNTDLYVKEAIQNFIESFQHVIREFLNKPKVKLREIKLADKKKIEQLLVKTKNQNIINYDIKLIHQKFEENVLLFPDKTAITDGERSLSYLELNKLVNRIANNLVNMGIKLEDTVGIYLDRRIEYIASVLSVLKAGGVFIALDKEYPQERLKYVINDSNINYALSLSSNDNKRITNISNIIYIDEISEDSNSENPAVQIFNNNSAYIVYTSGSTGLPKGVVVEHSKISYHINQMVLEFGVCEYDKYLQFAAFNFDASIEQIFVPLVAGAEIYLRTNDYWLPSAFIELILSEDITIINPPTIYWNQLVAEIKNMKEFNFGKLKLVIAGGEEMQVEKLMDWNNSVRDKVKLINAYGPTETIITSTIFNTREKEVERDTSHVPIGKCIGNRNLYIVDALGNLVPNYVPGELCFGGELISQGYLKNPELTAEKFIPDVYSSEFGKRLYRTGDLARYDKNGFVEYLGRIDNQVKVRGFRIELNEIQHVLNKDPDVIDSIATVYTPDKDNLVIFAFIVTEEKVENILDRLFDLCKNQLPHYMIPNEIILIDKIPINANGKLDKRQLPFPEKLSFKKSKNFVEPRTDLEKEIAAILDEVLMTNKIGIYDSFFDLGGNSILAIKVISKIKEIFGVEIPLKSLFENPTLAGLAEEVVKEQTSLIEDKELENLLDELENIEN